MFHKKAKTTKKIVLRLQCSVCKAVHMHPIKVSGAQALSTTWNMFLRTFWCMRLVVCALQEACICTLPTQYEAGKVADIAVLRSAASISRLAAIRRARAPCTDWSPSMGAMVTLYLAMEGNPSANSDAGAVDLTPVS